MVSMKRQVARRSKSSSSPQNGKVSLWISPRACELNSVWLTEGREKMRKVATTVFVLILIDRQFFFVRVAICAGRLPADDLHRHERIRQAALQVRLRTARIPWRSALPGV